MYDSITPEQWIIGLVISLLAFAGLVWLLWHYSPRDGQRSHMSTSAEQVPTPAPGTEVVHVPVPHTGTAERTTSSFSIMRLPSGKIRSTPWPKLILRTVKLGCCPLAFLMTIPSKIWVRSLSPSLILT